MSSENKTESFLRLIGLRISKVTKLVTVHVKSLRLKMITIFQAKPKSRQDLQKSKIRLKVTYKC